ncbi:alpha/beta hydrolase [Promineifilum sp.]|uniref:alpha/beta hydrolase n=1 Tax=Promineifilum sp. TaxID=2664178 RepID=UPI0035B0DAE0
MKRKSVWVILGVVALLLALTYGAASWYFSGLILDAPTQSIAEARAEGDTPADFGLPEPEEIAIDAGEVTLAGWYFDQEPDAGCALLFLHGFRGTRYHVFDWGRLFYERGCDVLAYDHRGHGDSTPAFHTYGFYEKQDAVAALDWLAGRSGLDRSQIGVFGVSYGAATALQMAPLAPGIAFVGADSAYSELDEILGYQARQQFPGLAPLLLPGALAIAELRADFDVQAVAPERTIADAPMPVLLIHSLTDEYTFSTHSEDIYANSDQSRTVLHLTDRGAPHARDISTDYDAYSQLVDDFLAQYAPEFGRAPQ